MSRNKNNRPTAPRPAHSAKQERYIQPSILLGVLQRSSYGYELIQTIQDYGFMEGPPPPGMIYRHLRNLENDGLVCAEWETAGSGPAKRMYRITEEGTMVLELWVGYMARQVQNLERFIQRYRNMQAGPQ